MLKISAIGVALSCVVLTGLRAQQETPAGGNTVNFPTRLVGRIGSRAAELNSQLTDQTSRYLRKMANLENKLGARISSVDPVGAQQLFGNSAQRYQTLESQIRVDTGRSKQGLTGVYPAYLDSLQGATAFLRQNPQLLAGKGANQLAQLEAANTQLQTLQAKMNDADLAKAFMQQRKQQIGQYLAQHSQLQGLLGSSIAGMNQNVYYYSQQLRQYREMWNNPDQVEQKALALLNRLPAFQTFMKENSLLGGLFHLPGSYESPQAISGLQTRAEIAQIVQGQVGAPGSGGAQALQGKLQSADAQLDGYKSKLSQLGAGNGDMDMPDFKANDQKTKTLWKRLEYGVDFQTIHDSYYFPMVTDFGASLGYKLGHNNVIGVGASYKLGWGNGIRDITFTSQGVGLRSFLQVKIKGSFSAAGGFEYNYTTPFTSYQQIKQLQYWTRSGLIGVTKTVSLKSRVFKKTSLSLLWDFLSYQQVPQTQPILFRIGYNF